MNSFRTLLRAFREAKSISQRELGCRCEPPFSRIYIAQLELGERLAPPDDSIFIIAKALALSPEETQRLLEAANRARLSYALGKNRLELKSFALCLADNFSKEDLFSLANQLQELATVNQ
jgi:transcriptional regulator with XRE-family HTH domain